VFFPDLIIGKKSVFMERLLYFLNNIGRGRRQRDNVFLSSFPPPLFQVLFLYRPLLLLVIIFALFFSSPFLSVFFSVLNSIVVLLGSKRGKKDLK
jgi:hypothetical protein